MKTKARSIWAIVLTMAFGGEASAIDSSGVIAVNIALDPDRVMIARANAVNARMAADYPAGFKFGPTYYPHITLLQRYVRVADLDRVFEAVDGALQKTDLGALRLEATGFDSNFPAGTGSVVILVEPAAGLMELHQRMVKAVEPYAVSGGTEAAFFTTPEEPAVAPRTLDYVENFVPNASGEHYEPHLTVGIATRTFYEGLAAAAFEKFSFSPVALSVYQLGNYGTCRKRLRTWRGEDL